MTDASPVTTCPNCGASYASRYCPECGQDNARERLDARRIAADLFENFSGWDSALGRTMKGLVTSPGGMVADYVSGRRRRFVNPARFCLLSLALWFLMTRVMGIDPVDMSGLKITASSGGRSAEIVEQIKAFLARYLNILLFLSLPIQAWLLRIFFRRSDRNIAECVVFVLYMAGISYLIGALLTPFYSKENAWIVEIRPLLTVAWSYWAALSFFEYGWFASLWRIGVATFFQFIATLLFFAIVAGTWFAINGT